MSEHSLEGQAKEGILVPVSWLETLSKYASEVDKLHKDVVEAGVNKHSFNVAACTLVGFASSAETILKYNKRIKE